MALIVRLSGDLTVSCYCSYSVGSKPSCGRSLSQVRLFVLNQEGLDYMHRPFSIWYNDFFMLIFYCWLMCEHLAILDLSVVTNSVLNPVTGNLILTPWFWGYDCVKFCFYNTFMLYLTCYWRFCWFEDIMFFVACYCIWFKSWLYCDNHIFYDLFDWLFLIYGSFILIEGLCVFILSIFYVVGCLCCCLVVWLCYTSL